MAKAQKLTEEQIKIAMKLRARGETWVSVAQTLRLPQFTIRKTLHPEWAEYRNRLTREHRQRVQQEIRRSPRIYKNSLTVCEDGSRIGHQAIGDYGSHGISIPERVELQRARNLAFQHTDLTAVLLGDPPPWRSALGKKNKWQ